jgi:chromosome segregation ATPase
MASSSHCSVCPKGAGSCYCPGCKAYFCNKDFRNHREMLAHGLDELTVNRNELQEKINKASSHKHSGSSLLSRIDAWQDDTIQKVKQAAQQARQQVLKIINSKREEITRQFQALSKEMEQLRETEDVLEQDLSRLKNQIKQLHKGLENVSQSPTIELNMKQSEQITWHRMIYVEDRSVSSAQQQRREQFASPTPITTKLERTGQHSENDGKSTVRETNLSEASSLLK